LQEFVQATQHLANLFGEGCCLRDAGSVTEAQALSENELGLQLVV
jgi:hypothetical protein